MIPARDTEMVHADGKPLGEVAQIDNHRFNMDKSEILG